MKSKRKHIQDICKELGSDYSVRTIDLERCIYRDFGNGFDVEISGIDNGRHKRILTAYLWQCSEPGCRTVKTVHGIECTADTIREATESLYRYSEYLNENGNDCRNNK